MNATAERLEFAPPPTPGVLRGLGLAILAHAFLVAALTWGVRWKQAPTTVTAEAELWAAVPRQAAPPPPPLEAAPMPPPAPAPAAAPLPPVQTAPSLPDPQIAIERERQRLQKDKQLAAEKLERDKRDKLRKTQEKQQALDKQRELEQQQRELDKRLAADKQKAAQEARRKDELKAQQEASKKLEAQRQANLQRMAGLAGSAGAPSSTGTAAQAAGPSAGYAGRVKRLVGEIYFAETNTSDMKTEVEFRIDAEGKILSRKIIKSSGNRAWDDAVLKRLKEVGALPSDVDGRIPPSPLVITFSP